MNHRQRLAKRHRRRQHSGHGSHKAVPRMRLSDPTAKIIASLDNMTKPELIEYADKNRITIARSKTKPIIRDTIAVALMDRQSA